MTPAERLEAIEKQMKDGWSPEETDQEWLINRVKRLTEALEFYENEDNHGVGDFVWNKSKVEKDLGEVARKALEQE